jgi:hypothetical protein
MLFLAIGILAASGALLVRADETHGCTLASLRGTYGYTSTGFVVDVGPVANAGKFTFDGRGHLTQDNTNVRNGVVRRGLHAEGTYTVAPDCRGSWETTTTASDFVINSGGNEVMFIRTDEGATVTGILHRQSED